MANWYNFAVARLAAHPGRDERLNVGVVIFDDERLDVRPAKNLDKIRAISAAIEVSDVRNSMLRLAELDRSFRTESASLSDRLSALQSVCPFELSLAGRFESHSRSTYEGAVASLLSQLVEPEPAHRRRPEKRSKLLSSLKAAFKSERVLAKKGEDLSTHRLVPSWPLAKGLSADLVLRNGAMHVIEAVDAQSDDISTHKLISDIAVSALVLEQARMTFGNTETRGRLVYSASASNESIATPSLLAAEHQGAELINWASDIDREKFVEEISRLAVPLDDKNKRRIPSVNSSTQQKFSLN